VPDSQWSTDPLFYKQQGQYFWYQNDHLGTPQKIISTSGRVVWSAVYDSFGNCQIETAEIENNLRFAGQYHDAETGLYYNLNRYYDPATGRYLRTDPYGDGLNLYAYVFNNPLNWIDPLGLCKVKEIGSGIKKAVVEGAKASWNLLKRAGYEIGHFGINVLSSSLEWLHPVLNHPLSILALTIFVDIPANIAQITYGVGLIAGASFLEIGTAAISTPVSIPAFVIGTGSVALGSIGLWEASNRITGALLNDRNLMNYDYYEQTFGKVGKDYVLAKGIFDIIRRPGTSIRKVLPYGIDFLRSADNYITRLKDSK